MKIKELDLAGLKVNTKKCHFFQKEVIFLEYKLGSERVSMDEESIKIIQNYERPVNLKTLRGFLGSINYLKKLIEDLSEKNNPRETIGKRNLMEIDRRLRTSISENKKKISENLKICHPQYDESFILRTDASENKFAEVLLQVQNEWKYQYVTKIHEKGIA